MSFFYYENISSCLRERCINDPLFFDQIEEAVRGQHFQALGTDVFDLAFVDYMCDVWIWRKLNPVYSPMSFQERVELTDDKSAVHSEQPDSSTLSSPIVPRQEKAAKRGS